MKKFMNKPFKFLLLVVFLLNLLIPNMVNSKTIIEVKNSAVKGDIYNPQTNTIISPTTINAYNYSNNKTYENGDVEVKKVVTKKNDNGLYNIEFFVRGKDEFVTKTKDTYIVFVIDRSYSMRLNNRWEDAKKSVINFSKELSKIDGIKMALVGFSGGKADSQKAYDDTVTLSNFTKNEFTSDEIGNYDTDNQLGGGTNIQAGLLKAQELLNNKTGTKYVVLLSDGVPTLYYDNNGYSLGSGNSNTANKIKEVPICRDAAINVAKELKNHGIEIYTIGYHLNELNYNFTYNGVNYDEKTLAIETLKKIASSSNHYYQSDSNSTNTITNVLKEIKNEITTFKAGYNPTIVDNVGAHFKLNASNDYGGEKKLSTNSKFEITDNWKSIGNFDITINTNLDKGWYKTNNNFTLTYEKNTGEIKHIKCRDNPEVYWEPEKYNYKVNYYFNNKLDENYTKTISAYLNSNIFAKDNYLKNINNKGLTEKNQKDNTNYFLDPNNTSNSSFIKISSNINNNVLNIYYIDTNFTNEKITKTTDLKVIENSSTTIPYTIEYNVDINNVGSGDKITTILTDTLPFEIDIKNDNNDLNGGIYDNETKTITWTFEESVDEYKEKHTIKKKINYNVVYKDFAYISSLEDNDLINNVSGFTKVNDKKTPGVNDRENIDVSINGNVIAMYVEDGFETNKLTKDSNLNGLVGSNYTTKAKDIIGYTLVEDKYPTNFEGKFTEEDIIVKYYYTKNNREIKHNLNKDGPDYIDNITEPIEYKINVNATIKNYVGSIKLEVVDTLPYKIDKDKSILDKRCIYAGNTKITCEVDYGNITEKNYNINETNEMEFNINEVFNLKLFFKDIKNKNIINNVSSKIILDNTSDNKTSNCITQIPSGNVIVNYITKDNKKLSDSIVIEGLVGENYETLEKEFDKYSLTNVIGNTKGKIKEGITEITYIYDLIPMPPQTGININNSINYLKYILFSLCIIVIGIIFKKIHLKINKM